MFGGNGGEGSSPRLKIALGAPPLPSSPKKTKDTGVRVNPTGECWGGRVKLTEVIEFGVKPQIVRNFFRLRRAENPMKCSGGAGGKVCPPSHRLKKALLPKPYGELIKKALSNFLFFFTFVRRTKKITFFFGRNLTQKVHKKFAFFTFSN